MKRALIFRPLFKGQEISEWKYERKNLKKSVLTEIADL